MRFRAAQFRPIDKPFLSQTGTMQVQTGTMRFEPGTMRFEPGVAEQGLEMGAAAQWEMVLVRAVFSAQTGQGRSLIGCI
jgi:hypothetical protein